MRARSERPNDRRAPKQREEIAPPHSHSSATDSKRRGDGRPSILAVWR